MLIYLLVYADHIVTFLREGNQDYGCDVYV